MQDENEFDEYEVKNGNFEEITEVKRGTMITSSERIEQLEQEINQLKSGTNQTDLAQFFQNPGGLVKAMSLTPEKAKNFRSVVVGGATGVGHKYLSNFMGEVPASLVSAFLASYVAKKFLS